LNVLKQPQTPVTNSNAPEDLWESSEKLKKEVEEKTLHSQSDHK